MGSFERSFEEGQSHNYTNYNYYILKSDCDTMKKNATELNEKKLFTFPFQYEQLMCVF